MELDLGRCIKGSLKKSAFFRLMRGEETVYQGRVSSMKHLKNEVDAIKKDVECGIRLDDPDVNVRPGDTLICYQLKQVSQLVEWDTGFWMLIILLIVSLKKSSS